MPTTEYYTPNGVYTRIRNAVIASYSSAYVTGNYERNPASFPCVFAREIGNYEPTSGVTLNNDSNQWESTFEVQVFSNASGNKSEAEGIMSVVKTAMKSLFYIKVSEAPMDNGDPSVYRIVARFRRTIGGSDVMPQTGGNSNA